MTTRTALSALCTLALPALLGGCPKSGDAPPAPAAPAAAPVSAEAAKEAQEIFANRCTPCHGAQGRGDGAASAGLTPKPRNFQDQAWQKNVTDEHIEKIVQYGGAAVGKSPAMPPNPDLSSKPQVISALRAHVRNLGKQ